MAIDLRPKLRRCPGGGAETADDGQAMLAAQMRKDLTAQMTAGEERCSPVMPTQLKLKMVDEKSVHDILIEEIFAICR